MVPGGGIYSRHSQGRRENNTDISKQDAGGTLGVRFPPPGKYRRILSPNPFIFNCFIYPYLERVALF